MALKPIIYRARVALNDIDNDIYHTLNLTLTLHPSETLERMMVRLLAYCLNYQEFLQFTKGLSAPNEPDIIATTMNDEIHMWIDIGEPSAERVKKASRKAKRVRLYTFNEKSNIWWAGEQKKIAQLPVEVFQFAWHDAHKLASLVERTMDISLTITGFSVYVTLGARECNVEWRQLQ